MSPDDRIDLDVEEVIERHPYRTREPWKLGMVRIMTIPYSSTHRVQDPQEPILTVEVVHPVRILEEFLAAMWATKVDHGNDRSHRYFMDNHYGYTVRLDGGFLLHLRFSDWRMTVWLPTHYVAVDDSNEGRCRVIGPFIDESSAQSYSDAFEQVAERDGFMAKRITSNFSKLEHPKEAMTELEGLVDRRPDPE